MKWYIIIGMLCCFFVEECLHWIHTLDNKKRCTRTAAAGEENVIEGKQESDDDKQRMNNTIK